MIVLLAGASVAGCATTDTSDIINNRTVRGAAIGAAGGAAVGAVVPGVSAGEGAAIGAAVGAAASALSKNRDYERTRSGYRGSGWSELDETVRNDAAIQDRVMSRYDTNRDNELDRGEGQLAARDLRRLLDTDNNGNISRDEYERNRDYAIRNL
jgi:hypothetical protein